MQFLAEGYSAKSLRMLESEEGQLNAIYALHGVSRSTWAVVGKSIKRLGA